MEPQCSVCQKETTLLCPICQKHNIVSYFCSSQCQKKVWNEHKKQHPSQAPPVQESNQAGPLSMESLPPKAIFALQIARGLNNRSKVHQLHDSLQDLLQKNPQNINVKSKAEKLLSLLPGLSHLSMKEIYEKHQDIEDHPLHLMIDRAWLYPSWYMIKYLQSPSWEELQRTHPSYDVLDYDKYGLRRAWGGMIVMPDIQLISHILNYNFKGGEIMMCPPERFENALAECDSIEVVEKFVETLWHYRNHSEISDNEYETQMKTLAPLKNVFCSGHKW